MSWNDHDCSQEQENFCSICENELVDALEKIKELEAKVKELGELSNSHAKSYAEAQERFLIAKKELDHIKGSCGLCHPEEHHQRIDSLESKLAQANAKIVELEVYATKLYADLTNETMNKDMALSTANKKAEKLVEIVKEWTDGKHAGQDYAFLVQEAKQALKEWRGEE